MALNSLCLKGRADKPLIYPSTKVRQQGPEEMWIQKGFVKALQGTEASLNFNGMFYIISIQWTSENPLYLLNHGEWSYFSPDTPSLHTHPGTCPAACLCWASPATVAGSWAGSHSPGIQSPHREASGVCTHRTAGPALGGIVSCLTLFKIAFQLVDHLFLVGRIIKSKNTPSWKGLIKIIKSNSKGN